MESSVVGLLEDIKFNITLLIAANLLLVAVSALRVFWGFRLDVWEVTNRLFNDELTTLYEQAKYDEVEKLCIEKLKTRPNHEFASWYLAKCHYVKGEHDKARAILKKLLATAPVWGRDYALPFLETMDEREAEGST